jgi:hypothetical protein
MSRQNGLFFSIFMSMAALCAMPVSAYSPTPPAQTSTQTPAQTSAQQGAQKSDFDQFPNFVQFTSTDKEGTETILRCGYSPSVNKTFIIDPEYHEVSVQNPVQHTFSRLQHIGDAIIATFMPPNGQGLILELVKADGSLITKNCKTEMNNDTISNCSPAQPVAAAAEIRDNDQKITPQCSDLLQQHKAQINPDIANPQLAQTYKAGFTQKINALEAP